MEDINEKLYLFHQGTYYNSYELLGCHLVRQGKKTGAFFRVWAPNAKSVSVVGDFNNWDKTAHILTRISKGGVWECFVKEVYEFQKYKFNIVGKNNNEFLKSDPYAFFSETSGKTASMVYDVGGYAWNDDVFLKNRNNKNVYESPINIYEVNLCSWKRNDDGSYLTYKQLARQLIPYVLSMGYTHIELMPIYEYPFDGSWGYQSTGYFATTSRFGTPKEFMAFVDACHQNGLGVIADWVPAHFPKDGNGLIDFDGTPLFEYSGWSKKEHKTWGTRIFDFGKCEVQSFLISSAMFLLKQFHIDGIRVDAVASMLYLDYDRKPNEWLPNSNGDNKNLEAIAFLQKLNSQVFKDHPTALMIAEESTAWPLVTKPTDVGGLGFNFKWNIGWMNDVLEYVQLDPFFRKDNHQKLTFSMFYAFSENFVLSISHDEVVHGKKSLLDKMFGEYDQKFSTLRAFFGYMYSHPGKKLNFMGSEFGQFKEWDNAMGIDFCLLDYPRHKQMHDYVKALNWFYLNNSELYQIDFSWDGFKWIVADDNKQNIIAYSRFDKSGNQLVCVINFSPLARENYLLGVPKGIYDEVFNSDLEIFGGTNITNGTVKTIAKASHGESNSISINVPPLSAICFKKKKNYLKV